MKLNVLQRWALKLGVPRSILNELAEVYYGYAIPNADGRYPDWWYIQQGLPTTYRDIEVPKEVLKKAEAKGEPRATSPQRVYIKVERGQAVGVYANSSGIATAPYLSRNSESDSGRMANDPQSELREVVKCRIGGDSTAVDTEEVIKRVLAVLKAEESPRLMRSTSVPVMSAHTTREDDIMSFIHDGRSSVYRNSRIVEPGPENPYVHGGPSTTNIPSHGTSTAQIALNGKRYAQPTRARTGPTLPISPRPTERVVHHQRNDTSLTNNGVLGYYTSPIPDYRNSPNAVDYRSHQNRNITAMTIPEEDNLSEWSGYNSADESENEWENESSIGRTAEYRRTAVERLAQYRQER